MQIEKVLVVDDSRTDLHLLSGYLSNNGYQTITASNGEEAIQMAMREHPDLILMDIVMPVMNGFEATRRLSRDPKTATIPILMVSMKYQESDRIWGKRQGARDFLAKPIDEDTLITKIRSL